MKLKEMPWQFWAIVAAAILIFLFGSRISGWIGTAVGDKASNLGTTGSNVAAATAETTSSLIGSFADVGAKGLGQTWAGLNTIFGTGSSIKLDTGAIQN